MASSKKRLAQMVEDKYDENRIIKVIKVSDEQDAYSIKQDAVLYVNGILYLGLCPPSASSSQNDHIESIRSIFNGYSSLSKSDILILEEIELRSDHKIFRAFWISKKKNVILKVYKVNSPEDALALNMEFSLMKAIAQGQSEPSYLIKFEGAFVFNNENEDLGVSCWGGEHVFKIAALYEAFTITLRQRLEIQKYEDAEIAYILIDIIEGLKELEKKGLPVGKITPKNIGLYQPEKNEGRTIYKYKFFDYSETDFDNKRGHSIGGKSNLAFLRALIKAMRKDNMPMPERTRTFSVIEFQKSVSMNQVENLKAVLPEIEEIYDSGRKKEDEGEKLSYDDIYRKIFKLALLPKEETVIFHLSDKYLAELDLLKSILQPDPYAEQEHCVLDTTMRQTLVKKQLDILNKDSLLDDLKNEMTVKNTSTAVKTGKNIDIIQLESLGEGGYCKVYKYFDREFSKYIAMKIFCPSEGQSFTEEEKGSIVNELQILQKIRKLKKPEYFVEFYGILEETPDQGQKKECLMLKMENGKCNMREVLSERVRAKTIYTQNEILAVLVDLLSAFDLLQRNGIAHRDIKPENFILINEEKCSRYKIADFGIGIILPENSKEIGFTSIVGLSKEFASPEVADYAEIQAENGEYRAKETYEPYAADAYSLGIVVLQMMGMEMKSIAAFKKLKSGEVAIRLKKKFEKYECLCELAGCMLDPEPSKRGSFAELLEKIKVSTNGFNGVQLPDDTRHIQSIENLRNEKRNSHTIIQNSIKMARIYYSIGDMNEANMYIREADQYVFPGSCYEMELLRLKGLMAKQGEKYQLAGALSEKYSGIMEKYKKKLRYKEDLRKKPQEIWRIAFRYLEKNEKTEVLENFWKLVEKI